MPTRGADAGASSTTPRIRVATDDADLPGLGHAVDRRPVALLDGAAQADPGHRHPVDPEVDGDDVGALVGQRHSRRGPARAAPAAGGHTALGHPERLELADEPRDGAAVEAHHAGELGPRHLPGTVDVPEQGAEVVAADGFLVGPRARPAVGGHRAPGVPEP